MPYYHCNDCHHEFEAIEQRTCNWCGGSSHLLEEETPLEKMNKIIKEKGIINYLIDDLKK